MSSPATLEIEPLPDGSGFKLAGELDLATAPQLDAALLGVQHAEGLVLDMSDVTFVDSSGFGTLLAFAHPENGARLTIVNASPAVVRGFELMGLRRHPSIELR